MEDSYYGEAKPLEGRHSKYAAADTVDESTVTESPAIDEVSKAVDGAEAAKADAAGAAAEAAEAEAVEAEAATAEAAVAASAASAETAVTSADKPQKTTGTGKKKRGPWGIVFIVALIVFICSIAALALIAFSYCQGQQKYEGVARDAGLDVMPEDPSTLVIDWNALLAVNPDTVAWVYVPNTVINYPVVQGQDNDHYLTYDFDGAEGWLADYGAIFLDYRNAPDFSDKASFIYGHHMNDGSMFAELANFDDQARFDECRTVYLLTPMTNYRLRTFALLHVDATDELVQNEFADDDEFTEYVQDKIDRSVVNVGRIPAAKDMGRIFALATCDDFGSGRYVLYAYIEDEKASGLTGTVGISQEDGEAVGFEDDLSAESAEAAGDGQELGQGSEEGQESEQNANDGSEQSE